MGDPGGEAIAVLALEDGGDASPAGAAHGGRAIERREVLLLLLLPLLPIARARANGRGTTGSANNAPVRDVRRARPAAGANARI